MKSDAALAHQARSLVSPDREPQLSADDRPQRASDAGHDHPQLAGPAADAADRSSALHGQHHVRSRASISSARRSSSRRAGARRFLYLPFLMALGVGLTITNTKAVLEALFGVKSAFARTPKYRVNKKGEKSQAKKYRKRLGIIPWIELAIGCYFAVHSLVRLHHRELLHDPVPRALRLRLLVHRPAQPAAGTLRALRHRRAGVPREAVSDGNLASFESDALGHSLRVLWLIESSFNLARWRACTTLSPQQSHLPEAPYDRNSVRLGYNNVLWLRSDRRFVCHGSVPPRAVSASQIPRSKDLRSREALCIGSPRTFRLRHELFH